MSEDARDARARFALLALIAVFTALLWLGLPSLGNVTFVWDSTWFQRYADTLRAEHRIPHEAENIEFTLPPGMPAVAVAVRDAADAIGPVDAHLLGGLPRGVRALGWVLLVLASGWLLLTTRAGSSRRRWMGFGLGAIAAVLAALEVLSAATTVDWVPYVLPDLLAVLGLVGVAALLGREAWPGWRWAPVLTAFATMLFPLVYRMGLVVHPDPLFALFAVSALWLTLRAHRRGWTFPTGLAAGALLAAAAWTRQSAVLIILAVGAVALLLGRREAGRYLAGAAVAVVLLAGPWWGYQASKFGNPIQSNLNRPGIMLDHEPLSFYVDVPADTVTNPWRLLNRNLLFPKFHVGLWSDWSGVGSFGDPKGEAKSLASTQSVLGFGGDALVLGALAFLGVPALVRSVRRRAAPGTEAALAALSVFFLLTWAAYLIMLVRFPQRDADPNSPHYLLFLAPVSGVLGVAAGRALWQRAGWRRAAVLGWTVLYTASWAMVLNLML